MAETNFSGPINSEAGFSNNGTKITHYTIAAGTHTWTGGGATDTVTVSGITTDDEVQVSFNTIGTQGTVLSGEITGADTITLTLDTANTSNDAVINYQVVRASA